MADSYKLMTDLARLHNLTFAELLVAVNSQGVTLSEPQLRRLLGAGDIAEQLGMSGPVNRREYPPDAATVLAAFLPDFERAGGKLPQAANMLRAFLHTKQNGDGESGAGLVPVVPFDSPSNNLAKSPDMETTQLLRVSADALVRLVERLEAVHAPDDTLLDREGAARLLACSPRSVGRYVKSVRTNTYRRSDILHFIAGLEPKTRRKSADPNTAQNASKTVKTAKNEIEQA